MISKILLALSTIIFLSTSCASVTVKNDETPSWYISPKQNDLSYIYGVGQGFTLQEATTSALADSAARLMVTISSESEALMEENRFDINQETRRKIKQNIEQIDFANFRVSQSQKVGSNFFIEVRIDKDQFIAAQKERISFLETKIANLEKKLRQTNPIEKRISLFEIIKYLQEIEKKTRILNGAGETIDLGRKLSRLAYFENKLKSANKSIAIHFDQYSPSGIVKIIQHSLTKEHMIVAEAKKPDHITLKVRSLSDNQNVYGAYITKLHIDFDNIYKGNIIASNAIEVTGSSYIGYKEAYSSALKALEERVSKDGVLNIIGITN